MTAGAFVGGGLPRFKRPDWEVCRDASMRSLGRRRHCLFLRQGVSLQRGRELRPVNAATPLRDAGGG